MRAIYINIFESIYGPLIIGDYQGQLCLLDWQHRAARQQVDQRISRFLQADYETKETDLHKTVIRQLTEYFQHARKEFDLPLLFAGSDFQQRVWRQLLTIPYGKTLSYLELSRQLGDEKAIRAVAAANGANAISIVVPCHRVIGSHGELTGYAGGTDVKQKLLQLEGSLKQQALLF
ncbi:MAG: methylated-DNA--[protein]-cysteine S-methyltransferase [Niabella sp.]